MSYETEQEVESKVNEDALWADFILAGSMEEKRRIARETIELGFRVAKRMVAELN